MARAATAGGRSLADQHAALQRRVDALPADDPQRDALLSEMEDLERRMADTSSSSAATTPPASSSAPNPGSGLTWKGGAGSGVGVVLGFFAWVWVVLPAMSTDPKTKAPAGITGVKQVLAAKFLNRGPDGRELP